jgi:hypothetical protein
MGAEIAFSSATQHRSSKELMQIKRDFALEE